MRVNYFDDIEVHKNQKIQVGWAKFTYSNVISLLLCKEVHHPHLMKVVEMIGQVQDSKMRTRKAVEVCY